MLFRKFPRSDRRQGIIDMQTLVATSFNATVQKCPTWLKSAARAILVLSVIASAAWMVETWLAFRGFGL
jgi:hypothetical protein